MKTENKFKVGDYIIRFGSGVEAQIMYIGQIVVDSEQLIKPSFSDRYMTAVVIYSFIPNSIMHGEIVPACLAFCKKISKEEIGWYILKSTV